MQIYYDFMNYSNVVESNYRFELSNPQLISKAQMDFLKYVDSLGLKYKGPLTYYLEQITEKEVRIHFLLPVETEKIINNGKIGMHSYYCQEQVLCCRVMVEELKDIDRILAEMKKRCEKDGCKMYGPLYYVLGKDFDNQYIFLKSGVIDK